MAVEWLFALRCGVVMRLRLRAPAFGVRVPAFHVGVAPFVLACPLYAGAQSRSAGRILDHKGPDSRQADTSLVLERECTDRAVEVIDTRLSQ